jgi:hypothetical protein
MVTVFVRILGLLAFRNMAGSSANGKFDYYYKVYAKRRAATEDKECISESSRQRVQSVDEAAVRSANTGPSHAQSCGSRAHLRFPEACRPFDATARRRRDHLACTSLADRCRGPALDFTSITNLLCISCIPCRPSRSVKTCVFHLREYTHVISLLSLLDCSPLAISHFILLAYRIGISMIMSHGHSCLLVSMTCGLSVCVYDHLGRWHVSGHSHERYYP